MSVDNANIVILGENFPVQSLDLRDFATLGAPIRERVRLPVLLDASIGAFSLSVIPERFQISIGGGDVQKQLEALVRGADLFMDYIGKRTMSAVGYNFVAYITASGADKVSVLGEALNTAFIDDFLGSPELDRTKLHLYVPGPHDERVRIIVDMAGPNESIALDFNYHFDLGSRSEDPATILNYMHDSAKRTSELLEAFGKLSGLVELTKENAK